MYGSLRGDLRRESADSIQGAGSVVAEAAGGLEAGAGARGRVQEQLDVAVVHVVLVASHRLRTRVSHYTNKQTLTAEQVPAKGCYLIRLQCNNSDFFKLS